jgi:hypothetical protein
VDFFSTGLGIALFILVVFIAAPSGFTWLGGHFLHAWLSEPSLGSLGRLGVSAASLGVVCGLMYVYTGYYNALFLGLIWGSATLTALVFVWRSLRTRRARVIILTALLAVAYAALLLQMEALRCCWRPPGGQPATMTWSTTSAEKWAIIATSSPRRQ